MQGHKGGGVYPVHQRVTCRQPFTRSPTPRNNLELPSNSTRMGFGVWEEVLGENTHICRENVQTLKAAEGGDL